MANVYVLLINHSHGSDMFACETASVALSNLFSYVSEWWESEFPDDGMPGAPDEAINEYFERLEMRESYEIAELEIMKEDAKNS